MPDVVREKMQMYGELGPDLVRDSRIDPIDPLIG